MVLLIKFLHMCIFFVPLQPVLEFNNIEFGNACILIN